MTAFRLVLRGLLYRWRTNLAVGIGVAATTAVLIGALGAGDSVRFSLRTIALDRLGRTELALKAGERFFTNGLAGEVTKRLGGSGASAIVLRGTASTAGGELRVPGIQVLGVGEDFWRLAEKPAELSLGEGEAALNAPLAARLGIGPGQEVLLRVSTASAMPGDAPLSIGSDDTAALRLSVKAVVSDKNLGSFGLRANQARPLNAFVSFDALARRIGKPGRANVMLLSPPKGRTPADADAALAASWKPADAGLELRGAGNGWELVSDRVFMEQPVEDAALAEGGRGVLTYFVDNISFGGRAISYSFVSAAGAGRTDGEPGPDEVDLNSWAARALRVSPGSSVSLQYLVPGPSSGDPLEKRSVELRVRKVVAIDQADRTLMPAFPGLAGVKNCRDWKPGVPLDLGRIGPKDQAYWDAYGGSPRAFLSLASAQGMWANRFGRLTAVRFDKPGVSADALGDRIMRRLDPASLGLSFSGVREAALRASAHGVDFGQLFLGLSGFLITAALLLTGLLFILSVEQREGDVWTLRALGFRPGNVRALLLSEGAIVAAGGAIAGLPLGIAYLQGILAGLKGAWQGAVRTSLVLLRIEPVSLAIGLVGGFAAALAIILIAGARLGARRRAARAGLGRSRAPIWIASASAAFGVCALLLLSIPESFFAAGTLALVCCLSLLAFALSRAGRPRVFGEPTVFGLGAANAARKRTRSLAVASLVACGIFIVEAVGANRPAVTDPNLRESGTGGFTMIIETSAPITAERERRLFAADMPGVQAVGLRVLEGEDASCLNLNRVERPRLLGVMPPLFRGRFTFSSFLEKAPSNDPWSALDRDLGPGVIPAAGDQSVIAWGLGVKLGDELLYQDERGQPLRVRLVAGLANSLLQGSIIVSERALAEHFPSVTGHRLLLVETSKASHARVEDHIARSLAGLGPSLTSATARLAEFNSVESAYLAVFSLLGWLGMLLGTLGLAVVVARNVAESRGETALLRAVGLGRTLLFRVILVEHLLPIAAGTVAGLLSSALAVAPAVAAQGSQVSVASVVIPLCAVFLCALACIAATAGTSLRAEILPALRNE